ncbi:hypothetical protein ACJJTC_008070 [Scirpophaga incertulas]
MPAMLFRIAFRTGTWIIKCRSMYRRLRAGAFGISHGAEARICHRTAGLPRSDRVDDLTLFTNFVKRRNFGHENLYILESAPGRSQVARPQRLELSHSGEAAGGARGPPDTFVTGPAAITAIRHLDIIVAARDDPRPEAIVSILNY